MKLHFLLYFPYRCKSHAMSELAGRNGQLRLLKTFPEPAEPAVQSAIKAAGRGRCPVKHQFLNQGLVVLPGMGQVSTGAGIRVPYGVGQNKMSSES